MDNAPIRRFAFLVVLALAACTPIDTGLGDSVRTNQALHVINPGPVADDDAPILTSGVRAAAAAERYRKGEVKKPAAVATTGNASGAGGPPK
ncbi:hypothetical protein [Sphingomonas koreensis]